MDAHAWKAQLTEAVVQHFPLIGECVGQVNLALLIPAEPVTSQFDIWIGQVYASIRQVFFVVQEAPLFALSGLFSLEDGIPDVLAVDAEKLAVGLNCRPLCQRGYDLMRRSGERVIVDNEAFGKLVIAWSDHLALCPICAAAFGYRLLIQLLEMVATDLQVKAQFQNLPLPEAFARTKRLITEDDFAWFQSQLAAVRSLDIVIPELELRDPSGQRA